MIRVGHAWDTHKLVDGRKLILGGVRVDSPIGLLGHSDNIRFKICKELNIYYRNLFSHDSLHNIDTVLSYHDGINSKLKLAFNNNIKPFSMIEKLSITLIVLLGKF